MKRLGPGLVCVVALAGCLDFSRFEHRPDAKEADLAAADLSRADLAAGVLVLEPFDTFDTSRWDRGTTPSTALTIDEATRVEGTGSLAIDVTKLENPGDGLVAWIGSALPTTSTSVHLRLYVRYDGEVSSNVNLGLLSVPDGKQGVAITLQPVSNDPSAGAIVVNNQYPDNFVDSAVVVHSGAWHCYELGVDELGDQAQWQASLSIDGVPQPAATYTTKLSTQVGQLVVGFGQALQPLSGAMTAWIDAVELTQGPATIGCPYD